MPTQDVFEVPAQAQVRETGGRGSLITRVRWEHLDGSAATWESRQARKRGFIELVRDGVTERILARPAVAVRLRRCNDVSGVSFILGGALFTLGALLAQYQLAPTSVIDWTFLIGGFWFSTGAYAALVQELNSPRRIGSDATLDAPPWRWWAYEPTRPGWLAAFVLFCGTLAFAVSLVDAFLSDLGAGQTDRLIWAPEMVGCILFLVSGHLGIMEVCHGRLRLMTRSLGWWIVIVNQIGSWLFLFSGLAAFVRPATGDVISVWVINWGTALGAACFSVAGLGQLFERPAVPRPRTRASGGVAGVGGPAPRVARG